MSYKPALLHFKFETFADLPSDVGRAVYAGVQTDCNDNEWDLQLFPGGDGDAGEGGFVALYLCSYNEGLVHVKYNVSVKDAHREIFLEMAGESAFTYDENDKWGWKEFLERSTILDETTNILKDGTLCVDVTIQVKEDKVDLCLPPDVFHNNMRNLLETGERADVSFNLKGEVLRAHSLILFTNAPILAKYCDRIDDSSEVIIEDTTPEVFRLVLQYVYTGHSPSNDDAVKWGKELIDAANKYELVEMKMDVENTLVKERILDKQNVADFILFADAQSCPLLKEYAISFFLLHPREVLNSDTSKKLRESAELLSEIITLMASQDEDEETVSVTDLRLELKELGLDFDGSKKALLSRLEDARALLSRLEDARKQITE